MFNIDWCLLKAQPQKASGEDHVVASSPALTDVHATLCMAALCEAANGIRWRSAAANLTAVNIPHKQQTEAPKLAHTKTMF